MNRLGVHDAQQMQILETCTMLAVHELYFWKRPVSVIYMTSVLISKLACLGV